eukprot:TRINITY_DN44782_c0_g1_i1.p1 TRINITY_DN44782_c0_g1~~TRINITY_DN44782_c0_g1_i1.p1  ORF type:complete len:609 (-),score=79.06 TRINITY_DN44782_c0_g1_i1:125-1951(-)
MMRATRPVAPIVAWALLLRGDLANIAKINESAVSTYPVTSFEVHLVFQNISDFDKANVVMSIADAAGVETSQVDVSSVRYHCSGTYQIPVNVDLTTDSAAEAISQLTGILKRDVTVSVINTCLAKPFGSHGVILNAIVDTSDLRAAQVAVSSLSDVASFRETLKDASGYAFQQLAIESTPRITVKVFAHIQSMDGNVLFAPKLPLLAATITNVTGALVKAEVFGVHTSSVSGQVYVKGTLEIDVSDQDAFTRSRQAGVALLSFLSTLTGRATASIQIVDIKLAASVNSPSALAVDFAVAVLPGEADVFVQELNSKSLLDVRRNFITQLAASNALSTLGGAVDILWLGARVAGSVGEHARSDDNLALGRLAIGSSDSQGARFEGATDGSIAPGYWWRSNGNEYPSFLRVDLGARAIISAVHLVGGDPGFWSVRIFRSSDADAWRGGPSVGWSLVRKTLTPLHCASSGLTTVHEGWPEATQYVQIQLERLCAGNIRGPFSLAELKIFGYFQTGMWRKYEQTWPHCVNLWSDVSVEQDPYVHCFSFVDLEEAKARCLLNDLCHGFSFQAGSINGGRGSGCYKTACKGDGQNGYGRGVFGYWEKRRLAWPVA